MFERFTDRARTVVRLAVEEARADGAARPVGTEHLLLGILADRDALATRLLADAGADADDLRGRIRRHTAGGGAGLAEADAAALREIGIDLAAIVARIEESFGPDALREPPPPRRRWGRRRPARGPFSGRAKKSLELALREALALRHRHIGTEHLLLGLLREGGGLGALVLTEAGVDLADLRRRVEAALRTAA
ncbi:Clp protease N-terminal domain-containing protein [Micromonospora mirobrigensis]|uniref:Clp amino terminal domain-containing protein, pathogenicity island component n=1 Tax=Micromonospora mirobrigensis TaxID=262898 RepID=A0A1C4ZYP2_9ACTN|nr:Clp protease N-terminal domain-containing protein [Micromonospora mirobrigensis]SCF38073.1 Clp amino terminal domain-containing protein, pathogenicity island component [Micromonospora mirobrigensis]